MSNSDNQNEDGQQTLRLENEEEGQTRTTSLAKEQEKNDFSEVKTNSILDFQNNELNRLSNEQKTKNSLQSKEWKQELNQELQEKLINELKNLDLSSQKISDQPLSAKINSESGNTPKNDSDLLYKKLQKKWGLDKIQETREEKEFMNNLLDKSMHINSVFEKTVPNQNLQQSEDETRKNISGMHTFQPLKRKNITEYNGRYSHEIDPILQSSHLDEKNEETPKIMRYMQDYGRFNSQINIGERWGQIIQQSAINRIQYEQQISKGGNLISYMARKGKLGVDLYFIVFGITAVFIIPYVIHQHQKQKVNYIQKTKNINPQTVPDFYYSEYDLDEISIQKSFYNQYTDEIMAEKNKKLKMHKEIQQLTSMLFSNK